jgi:replicative DNA helicase
LLSRAEQRIFSILERGENTTLNDIRDILHQAMDRIDARMKGEHLAGGVETGFTEFDHLTGGLHNSELIVLAARPSMGKTALAMNIAEYVALKLSLPVLFVSLEMSSIELADRMLCSVAEVNGARLRNGTISKEDRKRLVETAAKLSECPLFVDDAPSRTVSEIAAAARRVKRREGALGLIVIDYLQLIEADNSKDPRQEQVAKMARRLKGLAREVDVPVLCLAQLNRQAEVSKENRPRLSHLRESGAIEQDADVVMFVHREEYYRTGEDREQVAGQAEIIIAKQRNGPIGEVELVWRKEFTRFANPAPQHYEEFEQFNAEF